MCCFLVHTVQLTVDIFLRTLRVSIRLSGVSYKPYSLRNLGNIAHPHLLRTLYFPITPPSINSRPSSTFPRPSISLNPTSTSLSLIHHQVPKSSRSKLQTRHHRYLSSSYRACAAQTKPAIHTAATECKIDVPFSHSDYL